LSTQNTIQLTLTVKDDGSVVVQQFGKNTEDALGKTGKGVAGATGALATLKENWLGLTAAAAGAYLMLQKAMQFNEMAARGQQAEATFRALTVASGESADKLLADLKRVTAGTIEESDLQQKAVKGLMLDFSGEQLTKMAEAARVSARVTGQDIGTTFDTIVDAISTNMPKALKSMGLITKQEMAVVNQAIAAGIPDVNLYGIAMANAAIESAKLGGATQDNWERMQQFRAEIKATEEALGGEMIQALKFIISTTMTAGAGFLYMAAGMNKVNEIGYKMTAIATFGDLSKNMGKNAQEAAGTTKTLMETADKLAGMGGAMGYDIVKVAATTSSTEQVAAAKRNKQAIMEETQVRLDAAETQKKAIENLTEIMKIAGVSESDQLKAQIGIRETDLQKYYDTAKQKISQQTAIAIQGGKDRAFAEQSAAEQIKTLDDATLKKHRDIEAQKTVASFKTAQDDIKILTSRLGDYQKYYDSLKAKMDKNTADEKKHLDELKALRQQSIDLDNSAAAQLALINGTGKNQTDQQKYDTGRSALNSQFMDVTNNLSGQNGQEQIKALQDYMQKVTALQQQFAQGIQGSKDIFGKPQDIMSAAKVAEDASSDINRALGLQQSAVAQLTEEKAKQVQADQQWGQVLQGEAEKAKTSIAEISGTITDLSAKMEAMQKTIGIRGIDNATPVINDIAARLEQLHDKTITITTKYVGGGGGGMSSDSGGFTDIPFTDIPFSDSFAVGTPYVPRTGIYQLHRGEAVIPADQNKPGSRSMTIGDINIVIPANAAPQRPEDWRSITRDYIVPELRKMSS